MITRKLAPDVALLEDAETQIKLIVKKAYLQGLSKEKIKDKVKSFVERTIKQIKNKDIVDDARRSLLDLANRQINLLRRTLGTNGVAVAAGIALAVKGKITPVVMQKSGSVGVRALETFVDEPIGAGVPTQTYSKEYMKQVNKIMSQLARAQGIDPNDVERRNSLRNMAEMSARHQDHEQDLATFKSKGVRLVCCSTHVDCSDRCYPWQGRVYSLDGTSGTTEDGRQYVPLERATDIWYTTRRGKRYKNGLLGFNCRHKLYEYKPKMRIPVVTKEMQRKENEINRKQREYERNIRRYKEEALFAEDPRIKARARKKAIMLNKAYIDFSHSHGRAYYPDRVKLLLEDRR